MSQEYHKGMKTGRQIESPQFTSEEALQPATALISIVTLTTALGVAELPMLTMLLERFPQSSLDHFQVHRDWTTTHSAALSRGELKVILGDQRCRLRPGFVDHHRERHSSLPPH